MALSASEVFDRALSGKEQPTATNEEFPFQWTNEALPYKSLIEESELMHGIPKNLLARNLKQESRFNPKALGPTLRSGERAEGIAQILRSAHPGVDPLNPKVAIPYAAGYLKSLYNQFGSWDQAVAAYNFGPENLKKTGMANLPVETLQHVSNVYGSIPTNGTPLSASDVFDLAQVKPAAVPAAPKEPTIIQPKQRFDELGRVVNEAGIPYPYVNPYTGEGQSNIGGMAIGGIPVVMTSMSASAPVKRVNPLVSPTNPRGEALSTFRGKETISKPQPQSLWQWMRGWVSTPTGTGPDKAAIITGLKNQTGLTPTEILKNYDELTNEVIARQVPTVKQIGQRAMEAGIVAGAYAHPLVTASVVLQFMGMDELVNKLVSDWKGVPYQFQGGLGFSDLMQAQGFSKDAIDLMQFMGLGLMVGGGNFEAGKKVLEHPKAPQAPWLTDQSLANRGIIGKYLSYKRDKIAATNELAEESKVTGKDPTEIALEGLKEPLIKDELATKGEEVKVIKGESISEDQLKLAEEEVAKVKAKQAELDAAAEARKAEAEKKKADKEAAKEAAKVSEIEEQPLEQPIDALGIDSAWKDAIEEMKAKAAKVETPAKPLTGAERAAAKKKSAVQVFEEATGEEPIEPISLPTVDEATLKEMEDISAKTGLDLFGLGKKEPITDLDLQTGTPLPEALSTDKNPFRETDPEVTTKKNELYSGLKSVAAKFDDLFNNPTKPYRSPETTTSKLINDVNRWLDGDDSVDIAKTRDMLSEMAARADELKPEFSMDLDHKNWANNTSEAAVWARGADRAKIERTPGTTRLNIAIPLDEMPKMVRDFLNSSKTAINWLLKDIYRNKEIYDKTGFWLGRDGMWRYELDSSEIKIVHPELYTVKVPRKSLAGMISGTTAHQLPEVISAPKLFEAIPTLKDVRLKIDPRLAGKDGNYNAASRTITVNSILRRDVFIHELSHSINDLVGSEFRGSNYDKANIILDIKDFADALNTMRNTAKNADSKKLISDMIGLLNKEAEAPNPSKGVIHSFYTLISPELAKLEGRDFVNSIREMYTNAPLGKGTSRVHETYMKDPGEMQSRLEEIRDKMTPAQRKAEPPWETLEKMLVDEGLQSVENVPGGVGTKLYTGADIKDTLIKSAGRAADYVIRAHEIKKFKAGPAYRALKENFEREFVDRSGNIRQELLDKLGEVGYKIVQKMYLSKGSGSMAAVMLKQMQKEVYGGLSNNEKKILDTLILTKRILDIAEYKSAKQFTPPEDLTPEISAGYQMLFDKKKVNHLEDLSPDRAAAVKNAMTAYFDWMKKPLKDMLDAQLISQKEYDLLVAHNYRRTKLVDIFDKRQPNRLGKKAMTVYDSGVEALQKGKNTDIYEPSSEIMALEVFNRAYGRIFNNAANSTLLDLALKQPDNPFVRTKIKGGAAIPKGWSPVFVFTEGKRKAIYLSPEMSKEWIINSPDISYKLAQVLRYATGSPVLRTMATGINWAFALANLPRDIMHIWYASRVFEDGKWTNLYNSNFPVYAAQMGHDLTSTFTDALLRKGRYLDYIREGGGMEFLVHQGRLFQKGRHLGGNFSKIMDFLGYLGETSEIMTRLAIRERAIRQGKSPQEATFAARDYMDFGQGGGIAKAADNAFPYLNASIQGMRGLGRAFKENPIASSWKLSQFAAATVGTYIAGNTLAPNTMAALRGNVAMRNNVCIPLGDDFGMEDEKGQMRYFFFKLPLDPSQRLFKALFEAGADAWLGNKVDTGRIGGAMADVSPIGSWLPPMEAGAIGYMNNTDFWLNEDIWTRTDKPAGYKLPMWLTGGTGGSEKEYVLGKTPQAFIDLGKVTGLSPERSKYAISQLTTNGSMFGYLAGQGYDAFFSDLPKKEKQWHLMEALSKYPITSRFIGMTNPSTQYVETVQDTQSEIQFRKFQENSGLDLRAQGYLYDGNYSKGEVDAYINEFKDRDTRDRLKDRFKFLQKMVGNPALSFYTRLKGLDDETRARVYLDTLDKATPDEYANITRGYSQAERAGGIITEGFKKHIRDLRNQGYGR